MINVVDREYLRGKLRTTFGDLIIDKQRLPASQLTKRGIPAYVAEWVMSSIVPGEGPLVDSEARRVLEWTAERMPSTSEAPVVRHRLSSGEVVKVLTPIQVEIILPKNKPAERRANLPLLGIQQAHIASSLLDAFPDLMRQGMWGIASIEQTDQGPVVTGFKPMQASVDLGLFKEARSQFTTDEWITLLLDSMGLNADLLDPQQRLMMLARLLPIVQKAMHLIELAPKGTGKSYLFENLSPKVRLISSGSVTPAVLFVNNASGQWGLLARFKVVVLDEAQTLKFQQASAIVGGLKGYLANGRISHGGKFESGSDCSLVLLANIALSEDSEPVNTSLLHDLPAEFHETALLDRFRGVIPGWRLPKLGSRSFSSDLGLKADFFGDVLCEMRDDLNVDQVIAQRVKLAGTNPYQRNVEAVRSIAAGYCKLIYPNGQFTESELSENCVAPAVALRGLIWNELQALDAEYRRFDEVLVPSVT